MTHPPSPSTRSGAEAADASAGVAGSGGGGDAPAPPAEPRGLFRSLGPAIIVASVVLGPGSIYLSSRIGIEFGYAMLWVPLFSTALMICLVAIAARLGVVYERTLCEELAHRLGRPAAAFIGVVVFLLITGFQTSNNVAILFAVEPLLELGEAEAGGEAIGTGLSVTILVALNAFIIAVLFGLKRLYSPIEKLMIALVMVMLVGFLANLVWAQPAIGSALLGLIPSRPQPSESGEAPNLTIIVGFFATTVSIAGAFYQSYLVKEKGWGMKDVKRGMMDSLLGIAILGFVSAIIMVTAAAVLHGTVSGGEVESAGDVARQLEPLFGPAAVVLFCIGLFAGAFSSFLVNAMIGGTLLADGLGYGGRMDQTATRVLTTVTLLVSMLIAIFVVAGGVGLGNIITFAQALTVLGLPFLALTMLYLVTRPELVGPRAIPLWMKVVLVVGTLVVFALAARTANNVGASLGLWGAG